MNKLTLLKSLYDDEPDARQEPVDSLPEVNQTAEPTEEDPYADIDPIDEHTQRPRSESPWLRTSFWVGCVAVCATILLFLFSQFDIDKFSKSGSRNVAAKPTEEGQWEPDEKIEVDSDETKLAFADQDVAQERAESVMTAKKLEAEMLGNKENAPQPNASQQGSVSPQNTVTIPRSRPYMPPSTPSTRPQTVYRVPSTPRSQTPTSRPVPITQPKPPKRDVTPPQPQTDSEMDAAALYASIDNIGTYGGMDYGNASQNSGQSFSNGFDQGGETWMSSGETILAQLETPIFWSADRAQTTALAVVTQGSESIPTGTKIAVSMGEAKGDSSKLVALSLTNIVVEDQAVAVNGQTSITDEEGKPLEAKRKGAGSKILPVIAKTLLGAASTGADIINRPTSVTSTTGSFTSSVSQSRENDVIAALVQGGTDALLGDLNQRNQAALQENQGKEFFILKAGTAIRITAIGSLR